MNRFLGMDDGSEYPVSVGYQRRGGFIAGCFDPEHDHSASPYRKNPWRPCSKEKPESRMNTNQTGWRGMPIPALIKLESAELSVSLIFDS
jgi:hypothetical protein